MHCVAARYYNNDEVRSPWDIVLYASLKDAVDCPHDWFLMFSRKQWRMMGCRTPKKNEEMWVSLRAVEIVIP